MTRAYHKMGNLSKDAFIEREGHMVNDKGVRCITGYHKMGNLSKDALIKREGHMVNDKGVPCITGYHIMSKRGNTAKGKVHKATALGEHHSHMCISAICQRGASIKWEDGYPKIFHHRFDPERSGLAGQKT